MTLSQPFFLSLLDVVIVVLSPNILILSSLICLVSSLISVFLISFISLIIFQEVEKEEEGKGKEKGKRKKWARFSLIYFPVAFRSVLLIFSKEDITFRL